MFSELMRLIKSHASICMTCVLGLYGHKVDVVDVVY